MAQDSTAFAGHRLLIGSRSAIDQGRSRALTEVIKLTRDEQTLNVLVRISLDYSRVQTGAAQGVQMKNHLSANGTKLRRLFLCRAEFIRPVAVGGYPHCGYIRDDRWNGNVVGRMNSTLQWAK